MKINRVQRKYYQKWDKIYSLQSILIIGRMQLNDQKMARFFKSKYNFLQMSEKKEEDCLDQREGQRIKGDKERSSLREKISRVSYSFENKSKHLSLNIQQKVKDFIAEEKIEKEREDERCYDRLERNILRLIYQRVQEEKRKFQAIIYQLEIKIKNLQHDLQFQKQKSSQAIKELKSQIQHLQFEVQFERKRVESSAIRMTNQIKGLQSIIQQERLRSEARDFRFQSIIKEKQLQISRQRHRRSIQSQDQMRKIQLQMERQRQRRDIRSQDQIKKLQLQIQQEKKKNEVRDYRLQQLMKGLKQSKAHQLEIVKIQKKLSESQLQAKIKELQIDLQFQKRKNEEKQKRWLKYQDKNY